jgi:hypothetical protein
MALAYNIHGEYIWYPYKLIMDKYKNFMHCVSGEVFYFIAGDKLLAINRFNQAIWRTNIEDATNILMSWDILILVKKKMVLLDYYGSFVVEFHIEDTTGIEILKTCDSYIIYKLRDEWHIKERFGSPPFEYNITDAQYMWCHGGELYKYNGQDIHVLRRRNRKFEVYRKLDKSSYKILYIGEYIMIRHHCKMIILHPDGSISLLKEYHAILDVGKINYVESDDRSVTIIDSYDKKYLYSRSSIHHTEAIEDTDCVYSQLRQTKSARNI